MGEVRVKKEILAEALLCARLRARCRSWAEGQNLAKKCWETKSGRVDSRAFKKPRPQGA